MTWPNNTGLTKTHLNQATDDPSQARSEIETMFDKLLLVIDHITAGETVWHSGNDGATSLLDAGLFEGQEGTYYLDLANHTGTISILTNTTGTLTVARGGTGLTTITDHAVMVGSGTGAVTPLGLGTSGQVLTSNGIGSDPSFQTFALPANSVHQSQLADADSTVSTTSLSGAILTFTGGQFGFYPQINANTGVPASGSGNRWEARIYDNPAGGSGVYGTHIWLKSGFFGQSIAAKSRYITTSEPIDIGNGAVPLWVFAHVDNVTSEIVSVSVSQFPPWLYNGPTDCKPTRYKNGKALKKLWLPDRAERMPKKSREAELLRSARMPLADRMKESGRWVEHDIPMSMKNADMDLFPHPFQDVGGMTSVLLDPTSDLLLPILDAFEAGEPINDLVHAGDLVISNTSLNRAAPPRVMPVSFRWR